MKLYQILVVGSNVNYLGVPYHFGCPTLISKYKQLAF